MKRNISKLLSSVTIPFSVELAVYPIYEIYSIYTIYVMDDANSSYSRGKETLTKKRAINQPKSNSDSIQKRNRANNENYTILLIHRHLKRKGAELS